MSLLQTRPTNHTQLIKTSRSSNSNNAVETAPKCDKFLSAEFLPKKTIIVPAEDCNVIAGEWAISSVTESVLHAVITMPPIRVFMWPISELVARSAVTAFVTFVTCCHGAALRCPDLSHWSHPGTRHTQPTSLGTFRGWGGSRTIAMNL